MGDEIEVTSWWNDIYSITFIHKSGIIFTDLVDISVQNKIYLSAEH